MLYTLEDLLESVIQNHKKLKGGWVPARPMNYKVETWGERLSHAWMVLTGKAEAFTWPENQ